MKTEAGNEYLRRIAADYIAADALAPCHCGRCTLCHIGLAPYPWERPTERSKRLEAIKAWAEDVVEREAANIRRT